MKLTRGMVLRVLINRFHPEGVESLAPYLKEEPRNLLEQETTSYSNIEKLLQGSKESLQNIHYSWLVPAIQKFNGPMQAHLISVLPEKQRNKLAAHFQISQLPEKMHPFLKEQLIIKLLEEISLREQVTQEVSFNGDYKDLESLDKDSILDLIDCLGVSDIASELKQVVDKQKLAKIAGALTKVQKSYLKIALHERCSWKSTAVGVENWAGDRKNLLRVLHKRGMVRLALFLKNVDDEFRGTFLFKLDTGRANRIEQVLLEEYPEAASNCCTKQVHKILEILKSSEA